MNAPRLTSLLDVNVLVSLVWPNHVGHRASRAWFAAHGDEGWATTPVTEAGFVRVSSNRRAMPTSTTPAIAADVLVALRNQPGHTFWPDSLQIVTGGHIDLGKVSGYRQVTDAHLLALCVVHGGRLITFDRGLFELAPRDNLVELIVG